MRCGQAPHTLILIFYRLGFNVCMYNICIHIMIFDTVIQNNCISIIIVNGYDIFKYLIKMLTFHIRMKFEKYTFVTVNSTAF